MQINIENPSALRRKMTIELGPDEIGRELNRAYGELRRTVALKGFRPGRAPQKLLERFFGDQVRSEVIQKLVSEYTGKALEEHKLKPVAEPEIVTEEADLTKALRFSATFDVKPEVALRDYQGLKVQKPQIEVKEEELDAMIERIRERHAELKKVEDRTVVRDGDFALAEIEAVSDGKPLDGISKGQRLFQVSEPGLQHGMYDVIAGAEVGKPVRKLKSYGPDYARKELAGKDVEWHATVKEIYLRVMPALDDEFAKDAGHSTLAEMREKVRADLIEHARDEAEARVRQGLLDLVIERNPIEVPESLTARELRALEYELASSLEAGGVPHQQAEARAAEQRDELRTRAEKRARSTLIVDALADQEGVEVADEEVADRIAKLVTQSGRDREQVAKFYAREEARAALKQSMRREKALDLLLSRAQVEEGATATV